MAKLAEQAEGVKPDQAPAQARATRENPEAIAAASPIKAFTPELAGTIPEGFSLEQVNKLLKQGLLTAPEWYRWGYDRRATFLHQHLNGEDAGE